MVMRELRFIVVLAAALLASSCGLFDIFIPAMPTPCVSAPPKAQATAADLIGVLKTYADDLPDCLKNEAHFLDYSRRTIETLGKDARKRADANALKGRYEDLSRQWRGVRDATVRGLEIGSTPESRTDLSGLKDVLDKETKQYGNDVYQSGGWDWVTIAVGAWLDKKSANQEKAKAELKVAIRALTDLPAWDDLGKPS